jgi:hypothetical protein
MAWYVHPSSPKTPVDHQIYGPADDITGSDPVHVDTETSRLLPDNEDRGAGSEA